MDRSLGGNFIYEFLVHAENEQYSYYMSMRPRMFKMIGVIGIFGSLLMLWAYQFPLFSLSKPGVWSSWWETNSEYILMFIPFIIVATVTASFLLQYMSNQSRENPWLVVDMVAKQITVNSGTISIDSNLRMEVVSNGKSPKALLLQNNDKLLEVGMINPQNKLYVPSLVMQLVMEDFQRIYQIPTE